MTNLSEGFTPEERGRFEELESDLAYLDAPTYIVRVDGEDSTIVAGPNGRLTDDVIAELEVKYRRSLRDERPPATP